MEPIRLTDIIKTVKGELLNSKSENLDNIYIKDIVIDSRKITEGSLFVPILGEHFDGHDFIIESIQKGAICALTEKKETAIIERSMVIYVNNTIKALGELAKFYRSKFDIDVIGITGSVGKTTTKDMIYSVFKQKYSKLLKTDGNYNNEIGLPLTIFKLQKEDSLAILEMGMSDFLEIDYLSYISKPNMAVITNIGTSHIENLGSREGILKAKTEIFNYLDKNSIAVLNADDDMLITLKDKLNFKVTWIGIENKLGIYADNIQSNGLEGITCDIHIDNQVINVNIKSPGKHIIYAALIATALAKDKLSLEEIKKGIEDFISPKMRMNIIKTNSFTIINDAYNASPQSMKVALDVLKNSGSNRKVAILGDIFELGNHAEKLHKEIGEYISDIDIVICVGNLAKYIYENISFNGTKMYFETQEHLLDKLLEIINKNDIILVKASRGMYLEKTIDKIEKVELL